MNEAYIFVSILQRVNIGFSVAGKTRKSINYLSALIQIYQDARIKRDEIQTSRAKGERSSRKTIQAPQLFSEIASEWLNVRMNNKAESYVKTVHYRLNKYILPEIGDWPLKEITSGNILQLCRQIEDTGHDETARRVKTVIGQIFRFAIAAGWIDSDPTSALLGALKPRRNDNKSAGNRNFNAVNQSISLHNHALCNVIFCVYSCPPR